MGSRVATTSTTGSIEPNGLDGSGVNKVSLGVGVGSLCAMKNTSAARQAGFTLIEMLVSLVILSTGIVLVLSALETSAAALGQARVTARASFLMNQRMADLDLELLQDDVAPADNGVFEAPYDAYRWELVEGKPSEVPGLKGVGVELRRDNSSHIDLRLRTFILESDE